MLFVVQLVPFKIMDDFAALRHHYDFAQYHEHFSEINILDDQV